MTIPFTYVITFIPTQQHYYGVRFAFGCDPSDLWTSYFTSSKVIYQLIKKYGKDSFKPKITNIFKTSKDAVNHEHRFLTKVKANINGKFLNKSNGGNNDYTNHGLKYIHHVKTDEECFHHPSLPLPTGFVYGMSLHHNQQNSLSHIGQLAWNKGKTYSTSPCTDERRKNISNARKKTSKIHCEYCDRDIDPGNYKKYHGENCKHNPNVDVKMLKERSNLSKRCMAKAKANGNYKPPTQDKIITCEYCGKSSKNAGMMSQFHGDNCKLKDK